VPDLPSGTLTFLFTDIEGSTRLWEAHPEAMRSALARHDALLREAVESQGGFVFKTVGDAFYAVFPDASSALRAALSAQRRLLALVEKGGQSAVGRRQKAEGSEEGSLNPQSAIRNPQFRVRMALHAGVAEERSGDYFGPAVNRVARLLAAGHGGQVLLSRAAAELLERALPEGAALRDLGEHRLKDLAQPERIFRLEHPDLPLVDAPLRSLQAFRHNLPLQVTSFVGRERELEDVKQWLRKTRLLTLTGAGGTGKTRLSLQVAAELLERYEEGVWLVELAALADPVLVPQAVATALGVREETGKPLIGTVVEHLQPKQLLLILDNCEHLLAACAGLAEALLRSCPEVQVLATSREGLNIPGETTYRLPSLALPVEGEGGSLPSTLNPQPSTLLESEAVRLFLDRAAAALPGFTLTSQNAAAVAQICRRLDGIPLAIELAAARVRALPVEKLAERLDDCFRLLTGGSRTALPRQQTLRALIDWSYDLLSEPEQALLGRLSVFAGGWTLEAVERIAECGMRIADWGTPGVERQAASEPKPGSDAGGSPSTADAGSGGGVSQSAIRIPHSAILNLLTGLVEKSLVVYEEGSERYRLLETVRQYARDRLLERGESEQVRGAHVGYFLHLAEEAEAHLRGAEQAEWLDRLEREHDNLRTALEWSVSEKDEEDRSHPSSFRLHPFGLRLARALTVFWTRRRYLQEGRGWLARALEHGKDAEASLRGRALHAAGLLAMLQGDAGTAQAYGEASLAIWRDLGDRGASATALRLLGGVATHRGDYEMAKALFEESLTIWREIGNQSGVASALDSLAIIALQQGDFEAVRSLSAATLAMWQELGDPSQVAHALLNLGHAARFQGDYAQARGHYEECLTLAGELGDRGLAAWARSDLGRVALCENDAAAARSHLSESLTVWGAVGNRQGVIRCLEGLALQAWAQEQHPEGARRAARLFGAAEALREAIDFPLPPVDRSDYACVPDLQAALGEEPFTAAWAEGRAMTQEQAVACALKEGNGWQ
jgi:predicted ATPase/class 3 adenylate cyclase